MSGPASPAVVRDSRAPRASASGRRAARRNCARPRRRPAPARRATRTPRHPPRRPRLRRRAARGRKIELPQRAEASVVAVDVDAVRGEARLLLPAVRSRDLRRHAGPPVAPCRTQERACLLDARDGDSQVEIVGDARSISESSVGSRNCFHHAASNGCSATPAPSAAMNGVAAVSGAR